MITTADCQKAIAEWVKQNPGHVKFQFTFDGPADEASFSEVPATIPENWEMFEDGEQKLRDGTYEKGFDCIEYEGQLRAYVNYDNRQIINIIVKGE